MPSLTGAMNVPLKMAILESGRSQRAIAHETAIGEIRLSGIVTCRKIATRDERRLLAEALNRPQRELFPIESNHRPRRRRRPR